MYCYRFLLNWVLNVVKWILKYNGFSSFVLNWSMIQLVYEMLLSNAHVVILMKCSFHSRFLFQISDTFQIINFSYILKVYHMTTVNKKNLVLITSHKISFGNIILALCSCAFCLSFKIILWKRFLPVSFFLSAFYATFQK